MIEPAMTEPASQPPIEIGLIADLACPWCYLGLARLDRARAMRGDQPIRLRWWPFFLNPQMPPEGMDRQAYLRAKFGGDANAQAIYARIRESGRADGIEFAFERMPRTPNTLLAQRLILLADQQGLAEPMIRALFQALFIDGRDIGDPGQLIDLATATGLDPDAVARYLASAEGESEVVAGHRQAEQLGVRGVPVFVVDHEHAIAGAQPPEVLAGLLDLAHSGHARAPGAARTEADTAASG